MVLMFGVYVAIDFAFCIWGYGFGVFMFGVRVLEFVFWGCE